jgi:ubiquinone/menaquinone biosynthesis C-methylase UbiE
MQDEMEKWEREGGVKFLRKIGIRPGHRVLDFGARVGHYSIPAAYIVEEKGLIYAVDKEQDSLGKLDQKANRMGLKNIKIIKNTGEMTLDLENESIDVVLLYDVLHYFKTDERKILYNEVYRILKPDGLLSVYPKHVLGDVPLNEFRNLCLDDVKQEIQNSGFFLKDEYCGTMSHDNSLNQGCVFGFKKFE